MNSRAQIKGRSRVLLTQNFGFLVFSTILYELAALILLEIADAGAVSPRQNLFGFFLSILFPLLLMILLTMLQTGYSFITLNLSRSGTARVRDLFLGFRYHPGRLAALSLVLGLIQYLCSLPLLLLLTEFLLHGTKLPMASGAMSGPASAAGHMTASSDLIFALVAFGCLVLCLGLYVGVFLLYDQALFLFIDHQDYGVLQCLRESRHLMRKNKLNLFRLYLSYLGCGILVLVSLGIATLLVKPYLDLARAEFYIELTGNRSLYGEVI